MVDNEQNSNIKYSQNNDFRLLPSISPENLRRQSLITSIGTFLEAAIDFNELNAKLLSLKNKKKSYINNIKSQFSSFVDNKRKRFISVSNDEYYFLSNNVSINKLQMTHFNYFNLVQKNYQSYKPHFYLLFSYIFHHDKVHSYGKMLRLIDSNMKISINKGNFPTFPTMKAVPPQTLWRFVKSSQYQSFYTCFVFALIEKWIENKNADDLFAFFLDSLRIKKIYSTPFKSYDFYHYSIMLNLIYDAFSLGKYDEVMQIFLNYFNAFEDIEMILITYVKYCIYFYLQYVYSDSNDSTKNKVELNYFDFDEIISPYHESSRLIIELISIIFNVNIDIYYPNKKAKKFDSISFTPERLFNNNNIKLELIYLYTSYHLYYSTRSSNSNQNVETNCIKFNPGALTNFLTCNTCNKKTKFITYSSKGKDIVYCYNCLYDYICRIMNERTIIFSDNSFLYKELFTRPIMLSESISISDVDILFCFKESLYELLQKNLFLLCDRCNEKFQKEDIVQLECGCLYCSKCLNDFMKEHFEKTLEKKLTSDMEGKFMLDCIICNKEINLKEILNIFTSTYELFTKIRNDFFSTHCSICGQTAKKSKANFSGVIFEPLSVIEEIMSSLTPEQGTINHNLCWRCYYNILKGGSSKNKEDNVNICLICRKEHKIIHKQFLDEEKEKDGDNDIDEDNKNSEKFEKMKTDEDVCGEVREKKKREKTTCACLIM